MQDRKERPPIADSIDKRDNAGTLRPKADNVRHEFAIVEDEPAGYNPYDKPPPLVTKTPLQASLARHLRAKRDG